MEHRTDYFSNKTKKLTNIRNADLGTPQINNFIVGIGNAVSKESRSNNLDHNHPRLRLERTLTGASEESFTLPQFTFTVCSDVDLMPFSIRLYSIKRSQLWITKRRRLPTKKHFLSLYRTSLTDLPLDVILAIAENFAASGIACLALICKQLLLQPTTLKHVHRKSAAYW